MEKNWLKLTILITIIFFYNCENKIERARLKNIKKFDSIIKQIKKGDYAAESYVYKDYDLVEWIEEKPESIFLEYKEPISKHIDSISKSTLSYLNNGSINRKTGANIYTEDNFKSEIITRLPQGALIQIVNSKNKFKQYKTQKNKYLNGKWLEIEYYAQNNEVMNGYIFDDFINYHLDSELYQDNEEVIVVKNEKEFLEALGSNRTIEITAKTLNFEKYFFNKFVKNNSDVRHKIANGNLKTLDDIPVYDFENLTDNRDENVWGEKYFVTQTFRRDEVISLGINGYDNLIIRAKNNNINFIGTAELLSFNKCNNILVENINFKIISNMDSNNDCESAIKIMNSNSVIFNNVNLSNSNGIFLMKSNGINFKNSNFYHNSQRVTVIRAEDCENISLENCNFFGNYNLRNVISTNTRSRYQNKRNITGNLLIQNCSFANNTTFYNRNYWKEYTKGIIYVRDTKLIIKNSSIYNNKTDRLLVDDNEPWVSFLKIENCDFSDNVGVLNYSMFEGDSKIKFKECNIKNNHNYYSLVKNNEIFKMDNLTVEKNNFDKSIDTIKTPQNTIIINNLAFRKKYVSELYSTNNEFTYKKEKVLNDFYYITSTDISNHSTEKDILELFGVDLSFLPNKNDNFTSIYGKFNNAKMEGKWRFTNFTDENLIFDATYTKGILDGPAMFFYEKDSLLITGNYMDNKKRGNWAYYDAKKDSIYYKQFMKGIDKLKN